MREIKFRAWDNRDKIMIQPGANLFLALMGKGIYEITDPDKPPRFMNPLRFILLQFTGLLDKKGKERREIYQDDILEAVAVEIKKEWPGYHDVEMSRRRVRWLVQQIPGGFQLKNGTIDEYYAFDTPLLSSYFEHTNNIFCSHESFGRRDYIKYEGIKIIGNKWDHPHLLAHQRRINERRR